MRSPVIFLQEHFNDADGVVNLLNKHLGRAPNRKTAIRWFERNSIPGDWFSDLMWVLELEYGAPISLREHYTEPENDIFD